MTQNNTEAGAIAQIAQKPVVLEEITPERRFVAVPTGYSVQDMEAHFDKPSRPTGSVTLHDVDSFIRYVKKYGSLAAANIYIDADFAKSSLKAVCVLNDNEEESAGWRDNRAIFVPRTTEEWKRWTEANKKAMSQVELANFLEANIGDIVQPEGSSLPAGADVLAFVSDLQETRTVKYGSAINLQSGRVQIQFVEDDDAGTKGKLEVFREFAIGVRPFVGSDAYQVKAFLRYRIDRNSGAITFWFELQRHDKVIEDATRAIAEKIHAEAGLPLFYGQP